MKIDFKKDNGNLYVALDGRLDTTTAPELRAVLESALEGVKELTFDFEKLEYISSSGLRLLLFAQKAMNDRGTMKVIHANKIILEIFEVTGFADVLTIE